MIMNREAYEKPEVEIVTFKSRDVIVTSGDDEIEF